MEGAMLRTFLKSKCLKSTTLLVISALLPSLANAVASRPSHPYRQHWKHATFGKRAVAGVAAGAGVSQVRKQPRQWGGGASGFGKRVGAGFAGHAAKTTV